jgi:hypothetical protein
MPRTALQDEQRKRITELLQKSPCALRMRNAEISETLLKIAFAGWDQNGGVNDTCHTAKRLHEFVDEVGASRHPDYSPDELKKYLKSTRQSH